MAITLHELDQLTSIEFLRRNAGLKLWTVEMAAVLRSGRLEEIEHDPDCALPEERRRLAYFFECDEEMLFG